jgi:hypothetical protein
MKEGLRGSKKLLELVGRQAGRTLSRSTHQTRALVSVKDASNVDILCIPKPVVSDALAKSNIGKVFRTIYDFDYEEFSRLNSAMLGTGDARGSYIFYSGDFNLEKFRTRGFQTIHETHLPIINRFIQHLQQQGVLDALQAKFFNACTWHCNSKFFAEKYSGSSGDVVLQDNKVVLNSNLFLDEFPILATKILSGEVASVNFYDDSKMQDGNFEERSKLKYEDISLFLRMERKDGKIELVDTGLKMSDFMKEFEKFYNIKFCKKKKMEREDIVLFLHDFFTKNVSSILAARPDLKLPNSVPVIGFFREFLKVSQSSGAEFYKPSKESPPLECLTSSPLPLPETPHVLTN